MDEFPTSESYLSYARPTHVGKTILESPPYYRRKGLKFKLQFEKPLTQKEVTKLKGLGYWINQSVVIRLYTLLAYHGVISDEIKLRKELEGNEEVDIGKGFENIFLIRASITRLIKSN